MKKKVIINSIFLILSVIALAFIVYLLSVPPIVDLVIYYVFIIPLSLLIILFAVKIIISLKFEPNKTDRIICRICNVMICVICVCACVKFFYFDTNGSYRRIPQSENYQYCNSSNFVDYEENEKSEYLEASFITVLNVFNSKNTNITKIIDIDEKNCVLTIAMNKTDTESFILKNLKYLLYKNKFFKNKEISENDNIIYYYDKGELDGSAESNIMLIMGKSKASFVYIFVSSTAASLPIDETKALEYAKEMLHQE